MKQTLTFEVDVETIAKDIFEKEYEGGGYSSIKEQVKQDLKTQAKDQIVAKLLGELKIEEWVAQKYYGADEHLTELCRNAISSKLNLLTDAYIKDWINKNMKWVVEKSLRNTLDTLLVPRLQKMIANMLIVDTESEEEQMREMEKALQDEAKGAYEQGQIDAEKEIKNRI